MAWKGREQGKSDYASLRSILVNSKIQVENNALFQTIDGLITGAQAFSAAFKDVITKKDKISLTDQVAGILPGINGGANPGYYYPELIIAVNVSAVQEYYSHYIKFANYVVVFGKLNADAVAANIETGVDIQLPIVSKFTTSDQCHGIANGLPLDGATEGVPATITGNVGNGTAALRYYPPNTDNMDFRFMFSYQII